ncbi:hypothetical protein NBRC111893_547 [Lentilactobacillus kosonis]|uniref:Uncharacterized protein n=1 Tax=Lentilactobacillus kosonis TaxID=2810561 RepID=A0A401FJJ0_9LACO|nr:hypothetical protein NBRC111893_547 [Lentilactobacillus kosonis]
MHFFNSWLLRLIGPIDKEQQMHLFKLSENGLVLSFILNFIALIISIVIDLINQQLTFQTVLIYIMLIIISGYIATKVSGKDVSQYEVYSKAELANLRKRLRLISVLQTFYAFLVFNFNIYNWYFIPA